MFLGDTYKKSRKKNLSVVTQWVKEELKLAT